MYKILFSPSHHMFAKVDKYGNIYVSEHNLYHHTIVTGESQKRAYEIARHIIANEPEDVEIAHWLEHVLLLHPEAAELDKAQIEYFMFAPMAVVKVLFLTPEGEHVLYSTVKRVETQE